ncbi:MAG: CSLREA domain-containing protein [Nitrospinota bacterium]|nr:CSLREA domain-containing protein [Nitrospinota bacterium]
MGSLVLFLLSCIWMQGQAMAATISVTTTADTVATDGVCSLREAINNANLPGDTTGGDCVTAAGGDTIILPAGTYTLTGASGDDANTSGDLDILVAMTIQAAGADARCTEMLALAPGDYQWKVLAEDGRGGQAESEARNFTVK